MNVFVPYLSPLDTAQCLDRRRLNKQVLECTQIINIINGVVKPRSWHPIYSMYENSLTWLGSYCSCLKAYRDGYLAQAVSFSTVANTYVPKFLLLNKWYLDNMKSRLYTKDPIHYEQFAKFGKSDANYYFVDNVWYKYENGVKSIHNVL